MLIIITKIKLLQKKDYQDRQLTHQQLQQKLDKKEFEHLTKVSLFNR